MTYALTMLLVTILIFRGSVVSVENPSSSYFWPIMDHLADRCVGFDSLWHVLEAVHFQACVHGSSRDKWTCWYGTQNTFQPLALKCDGQHLHETWVPPLSGSKVIFPTSQEAAYTRLLCQRVTQCFMDACKLRGTVFPADSFEPQRRLDETKFPGKRGVKTLPPLVSEYGVITDKQPDHSDFKQLAILPPTIEKWEWGTEGSRRRTRLDIQDMSSKQFYGIFRSPAEFVDAALEARHPIDYAFPLPDVLVEAVKQVLEDGPALTNARRKLNLKKIQRQALALKNDEKKLHSELPGKLGQVLEGKNLLLWKSLMEQTNFQDESLFDETTQGFSLVGQAKVSHEFPYHFQPAKQTIDELQKQSKGLRAATAGKCRASDRPDLDDVAWNKTLEERDKDWLSGPFSESEIGQMVGHDNWIAHRRFPLEQKDKVRLIDDCNASGLNVVSSYL